MIRTKAIALAAVIAAVASTSTPAAARSFTTYATTTPILYRYAACIFDESEETLEGQIEKCAVLKDQLNTEAKDVILRFHVLERYDVERDLRRGMREMENDLKQIRGFDKDVPAGMIEYWRCMGEGVMATEDFQEGVAVDYIGIEQPCFEKTIKPARETVDDSEATELRLLYRRFRRNGRLTWPAARMTGGYSRSGRRLAFAITLDRGFLNIGQLSETNSD